PPGRTPHPRRRTVAVGPLAPRPADGRPARRRGDRGSVGVRGGAGVVPDHPTTHRRDLGGRGAVPVDLGGAGRGRTRGTGYRRGDRPDPALPRRTAGGPRRGGRPRAGRPAASG